MAQRGALTEVRRFAYSPETGGVRGATGTFVTPTAYSDLNAVAIQEELVDGRQLGSVKSEFASHLGGKSATLGFSMKLTENSVTHCGQLIKAALGKQYSQTALTLDTGSTNAITKISAGVPDPIIKITYNTGRPDYLPVKTYDATDITHAILSRKGARTVAGVFNAKETSTPAGACYAKDHTADYLSFHAEVDQGSEPDSNSWQLQGLVPSKLELAFQTQDRVGFDVEMTGVDWSGPAATHANVTDQGSFTKEFLGYVWYCNIQDLGTPAAAVQSPVVAIAGLNLAPTWIPNTYSAGRAANSTIPGSNVNGWKQGVHFTQDLEITLDTIDQDWDTARQSKTKYQLLLTGYAGQPGDADTNVIVIWFPEVVLNGKPEEVDVNGIVGYKLRFKVQHSLDITAAHQTSCVVAFFNS
jgi:hypothetical protein